MMPFGKIDLFNKICCTVSITIVQLMSITIVQLILLVPKNVWLNKIFLIRNSQNRLDLSLFIAWWVIIPFVLVYHINY